ncbi:class I SAM-dependent methyltransferase [Streptomyces sp. ME19-01-6]|uniref:class I SAM-dependent methyltransferase n=1 Tax=Streptomyces sp. ME19-01-6 TaxID=3028686 RepID=UPI0029A94425|nr:L-histidine N(alpha)-methyltransferase [Streptomyces sp. ME19-01-6]MDX3231536.1 methyltransferase domain-containing protein [Streptomyces sp. ME19-01-6]
MTTSAERHYEQLLAAHYTWMTGGDVAASAEDEAKLLRGLGVAPASPGPSPAVDLGCGPGAQALALAALGFSPVIAVDTSQALLDELTAAAKRFPDAAIRPVRADLRTALPELTAPGETDVIVCMGDTLTHLPAKDDVPALLADAARALAPGGRLVITYRDLTRPLEGTDRFLPVRSDADRILTCFLEYIDADTVRVHDLLHLRTAEGWTLRTSSYPKLRIAADWLAGRCRDAGLEVAHDEVGPRGMRVLVAVRPR